MTLRGLLASGYRRNRHMERFHRLLGDLENLQRKQSRLLRKGDFETLAPVMEMKSRVVQALCELGRELPLTEAELSRVAAICASGEADLAHSEQETTRLREIEKNLRMRASGTLKLVRAEAANRRPSRGINLTA